MYAPMKKGGMCLTRKYRNWIEHNLPIIKEGLRKPERFPVNIEITVVAGRGWNDSRDIDNTIKPLVDLLVRAEVLPDDKTQYVNRVTARYMPFLASKKSEALTRVAFEEPEDDTMDAWAKNENP